MGTYTHDQGTVLGTFSGGVFRGWWSEIPSRNPTNDAGEVELRSSPNSPELDARFRDPTAFRPHP